MSHKINVTIQPINGMGLGALCERIEGDTLKLMKLREFIDSITLINGPYHDLDRHRIVADARTVLKETT